MIPLLAFFFVALGFSFFCSLLEAIILSTPMTFINVLKRQGNKVGVLLEKQKTHIDRPLGAILTLNTVAHTVGAAGVGAAATNLWGDAALGIVSAVLTFLILVLSEIIPKTIGASQYKRFSTFAAYSIQGLVWFTFPVVKLLELISTLFRSRSHAQRISRDEIAAAAALGKREGVLKTRELKIITNLMELEKIAVRHIMTPRPVVYALEANLTIAEVIEKRRIPRFSRIPIYSDSIDRIDGLVLRFEVLEAYSNQHYTKTLHELMHPIHAIPGSVSITHALERFLQDRVHFFVVLDEYGGTAGIVTMEDAFETLVGSEIVDETDPVTDMQALAIRLAKRRQNRRQYDLHATNDPEP